MKIIVALVIVVALYFTLFHGSQFKASFVFGGAEYSHNRTQRGGDLKNHFYTLGDSDPFGNRQLVQIIELPDGMLPEQYEYYMEPLYKRYKLQPYERDPLTRVGAFEQTGLKFKSYSTKLEIGDETHIAFYLTSTEERRNNNQVLRELARISFD